ncbi:MAG: hypothetical protein C4534_10305 [Gaiellales bacterium]|nr:MAG: hypothetical protein C4534_10305 [Gaiellales bacterium]
MLARAGNPIPYVCVLECQKRGAIHPHFGVKGFQDVRLLRRCWYKIVGKGLGQVNVSGPKGKGTPAKLGRYMSKYVSKDFAGRLPREFGEHRYFCSLGINVPTERYQIVLSHEPDDLPGKFYALVFHEVLRRIGDHCSIQHWSG